MQSFLIFHNKHARFNLSLYAQRIRNKSFKLNGKNNQIDLKNGFHVENIKMREANLKKTTAFVIFLFEKFKMT